MVFPLLHGPYGEDGTIQGLLELAGLPYVGAGVLASAVGMDKAYMKLVFAGHGLPVAPYVVVKPREWEQSPSAVVDRVQAQLRFPVFVKPARAGSSLGVTRVDDLTGLSGRRPSECSGGQAQRVAVARALAADPAVLLLDEPSTALDAGSRRRIHGLLGDRNGSTEVGPSTGTGRPATLLVTHDPAEVADLADRVVEVASGRIVPAGRS